MKRRAGAGRLGVGRLSEQGRSGLTGLAFLCALLVSLLYLAWE